MATKRHPTCGTCHTRRVLVTAGVALTVYFLTLALLHLADPAREFGNQMHTSMAAIDAVLTGLLATRIRVRHTDRHRR